MDFLRQMVEIGMLCERASKVLDNNYNDIDFDNLFIREDIVEFVESDDTGEQDFHLVFKNGMKLYFLFNEWFECVEWSLWDKDDETMICFQQL